MPRTPRQSIHTALQEKPRTGLGHEVRIIGGAWRGRKLRFPQDTTIRPTPDRVRETVFNWLQARLQGARVLDLYAGSGAFGFESLSRGAATATLVDADPAVKRHLEAARALEDRSRNPRIS